MVYTLQQDIVEDKVIEYKTNSRKTVKLPVIKKKGNRKVIGFLSDVSGRQADDNRNYLLIKEDSFSVFIRIDDQRDAFSITHYYIPVSEDEVIAVTASFAILFFLIFGLLGFYLCWTCIGKEMLCHSPRDEPYIDTDNPNQVTDIPEYIEEYEESPQVWVSGTSVSKVNPNYKNVYLMNDPDNIGYLAVYEVYTSDNKLLYKTGYIEAGAAEPFNAYDCKDIHEGENSVYYEVYFYDKEMFCVASSTINGLTILKN